MVEGKPIEDTERKISSGEEDFGPVYIQSVMSEMALSLNRAK